MDTMTMKFIVILTVFKVLQVQCDRSNKGFVSQLRNFKREMRADLTYIENDISTLFDTVDDLKKSGTIASEHPLGNKTIEQGRKCAVECREVTNEISQVNSAILKALESEKRLNRQLKNKVQDLESEVRINRQLQNKLQALESEMSMNRELQNKVQVLETEYQIKLSNVENALSDIAVNMDKFMTNVNETLQKTVTMRPTNNIVHVDSTSSHGFKGNKREETTTTSTPTTTNWPDEDAYYDFSYIYEFSDYDHMVTDTTTNVPVSTRKLLLNSYCTRADRSGVFDIESINIKRTVYCDADTDGGGWIVIMRRQDGSVNFDRKWDDYKNGFGNIEGDFWMGNDLIHALTKSKSMELRIDMEDFDGNKAFAKYRHFRIGPESENYILRVGGYSGTAGDSLANAEYMVQHNGMAFTTKDKDNDRIYANCAEAYGGWWYHGCGVSHLMGKYGDKESLKGRLGIFWYTWTKFDRFPKYVDMKIR